jgi:hypothetical protein
MAIFTAYIPNHQLASSIPHWFVEVYVKDYTFVLKQAVIIPPVRDTAEDVNTTLSLLDCPVNVVGCG